MIAIGGTLVFLVATNRGAQQIVSAIVRIVSNNYCTLKGGKMFMHSFSRNCEIMAKDAGKSCISDSECEKNNCVYPIPDSCLNNFECDYPQDYAPTGKCDDYLHNNDGVMQCHRPDYIFPTGPKNEEEKIICDFLIS